MISKFVKFFVVYLFLVAGLLYIFSPAYMNKFVQHDNYYHYLGVDQPAAKESCLNHPQYRYVHSIGRPIAAAFECGVFKYIHSSSDHQQVRIFIIGLMGVLGLLMFILFKKHGLSDVTAFTFPFVFLLLPGSQHAVLMTSVNNVVAYAVSVWAVLILPLESRDFGKHFWRRMFFSFLALLYCAYSYQSTVFFPFALICLIILFSPRFPSPARAVALPVGVFLIAGLFYHQWPLLFVIPEAADMTGNIYPMPAITEIFRKLLQFHGEQLWSAFNFWFATLPTEFGRWLYIITAVILFVIFLRLKSERMRIFLALIFFYLTTASVVLSPQWSPRVLQPVTFTVIGFVLYVIFALFHWVGLERKVWLQKITCFATVFLASYFAYANVLMNVTNQIAEGSFFRTALASHGKKLTHIHVVSPKPGDSFIRDMYGVERFGDADHLYNIEQYQNLFHMIRYHGNEMFPGKYHYIKCELLPRKDCVAASEKERLDPKALWVTISYVGDDFCVYPDTLVVNTFDYLASWNATKYISRTITTPPFDENLLERIRRNRKQCKD